MIRDQKEMDILALIDKDPLFDLLEQELESESWELRLYRTGSARNALSILEDPSSVPMNDFRPRLVVLDCSNPEEDGLHFFNERSQREGVRKIPVVVLSANGDAEWVQTVYGLGATSVIPIPDAPEKRGVILEVMKQYWLGIVKLPTPV